MAIRPPQLRWHPPISLRSVFGIRSLLVRFAPKLLRSLMLRMSPESGALRPSKSSLAVFLEDMTSRYKDILRRNALNPLTFSILRCFKSMLQGYISSPFRSPALRLSCQIYYFLNASMMVGMVFISLPFEL